MAKDVRARRQPGRWPRSSHPSKDRVTAHWPSARAPTIHGAKLRAEAAGWNRVPPVGELPRRGEAGRATPRGAPRSEDAGTSSEAGVGIPRAECPRFPGEGSSSQGQPGPKPRPGGVGEGRRVDIPWPRTSAITDAGTALRGPGRVLDAPVRGSPPGGREVLPLRRRASRRSEEAKPAPQAPWKSRWGARARPYRNRHRWAGGEHRGERADRGQGTRQNRPVT